MWYVTLKFLKCQLQQPILIILGSIGNFRLRRLKEVISSTRFLRLYKNTEQETQHASTESSASLTVLANSQELLVSLKNWQLNVREWDHGMVWGIHNDLEILRAPYRNQSLFQQFRKLSFQFTKRGTDSIAKLRKTQSYGFTQIFTSLFFNSPVV